MTIQERIPEPSNPLGIEFILEFEARRVFCRSSEGGQMLRTQSWRGFPGNSHPKIAHTTS
jgi:hypothetical protein